MRLTIDSDHEYTVDRGYLISSDLLEELRCEYPTLSRDSIIRSFGVKRFIV